MAQIRYQLTIQGTETDGVFSSPSPNIDSGLRTITVVEFNKMFFTLAGAAALDLDSAEKRGGILDVEFLSIRSTQVLLLSRANTDAEEWRIAANEWFMAPIHDATGGHPSRFQDFRIENTSGGTVANVTMIIGGNSA
jgi:hypothetical protein